MDHGDSDCRIPRRWRSSKNSALRTSATVARQCVVAAKRLTPAYTARAKDALDKFAAVLGFQSAVYLADTRVVQAAPINQSELSHSTCAGDGVRCVTSALRPGEERKGDNGDGPAPPPVNLKVLKVATREEAEQITCTFASGLGVQCSYCHVQDNFASDDNPKQEVARA